MLVLSYGYLKPQDNDTGDKFFPAMEVNIQKLNDHTHDGTNSSPLASKTVNILAANWVAAPVGGGVFRQSVTVPTGFSYDTCQLWIKVSTGEVVYPTIERITAQSFYVYTNDNTLDYVAYFR